MISINHSLALAREAGFIDICMEALDMLGMSPWGGWCGAIESNESREPWFLLGAGLAGEPKRT